MPASSESSDYPSLGQLRLDSFGSWEGESAFASDRRISVRYVPRVSVKPRPTLSLSQVTAIVREIVERVYQNEWDYRLVAARAWLEEFKSASNFPGEWDDERLARCLILRGIILGGNSPTIILEHAAPSIDKELKTWFNPDGSLSHISGSLD